MWINIFLVFLCGSRFFLHVRGGAIVGHATCLGGYLHPDRDLENTMGYTCRMDMAPFEEMHNVKSDDDYMKLYGRAVAIQWKCIFGLYKGIDSKGKVIASVVSEKFFEGIPAAAKKEAKKKLDDCVTKNNPKIKKETKARTWVDMAICIMKTIESNPCAGH